MAKHNSSRVITQQATNNNISRLLTAVDLSFDADTTKFPEGTQYGFRAILKTDGAVLENNNPYNNDSGFDMEFEIPFDDDMVANEAEFVVYNLTKETVNKFKVGNSISMTAGYGDDTGVIFSGYISKVKTVRQGVDRVTTIYALDDVKYTPQMMDEKTYSSGTKASAILKDLLNKLGLEIAVFSPKRDHIYYSEATVEGSIVDSIKTYSDVCGVITYIHKQKIYCRAVNEGDNLHFNINSDTGMIDSPEPFEEENSNEEYIDTVTGYEINMILQHRIATAGIVNVDSTNYQGEYRIVSGTHGYDGLSATTKFKCIDTIKTTIDESKIETEEDAKKSDGTGNFEFPFAQSYTINSGFVSRTNPVTGMWESHTGLDIGAPYGTNILASDSGTVTSVIYSNEGYGNNVVITHSNGFSTLYAHASELLVSKGEKVKQGQAIAKVGSTGQSTGAHLHFEIRKNNSPVDPAPYVL